MTGAAEIRGGERSGVDMALTVGYDGKFLWQGKSFGSRSGHGVHARQLLKEMLECWPQGRFKVYALDDEVGIDHRPNCQVVTLPRYARSHSCAPVAYPIELKRHPVDVLLSFSTLPAYAPCKTVLLLADVFWLANPGWLPSHIALPRTLATRSSVKRADRIVTTTEFSRREIMRILHVPSEKIVVVPHGVRTEFTERLSAARISDVRTRYSIGPQYILSLNDIHPRKNLEGLVEAFGRLKSRSGLPHQLVIAGRSLWPYPDSIAALRAVHSRMTSGFSAMCRPGTCWRSTKGPALFVYPSFYEGWGLRFMKR